jgi:hypothetical protein
MKMGELKVGDKFKLGLEGLNSYERVKDPSNPQVDLPAKCIEGPNKSDEVCWFWSCQEVHKW